MTVSSGISNNLSHTRWMAGVNDGEISHAAFNMLISDNTAMILAHRREALRHAGSSPVLRLGVFDQIRLINGREPVTLGTEAPDRASSQKQPCHSRLLELDAFDQIRLINGREPVTLGTEAPDLAPPQKQPCHSRLLELDAFDQIRLINGREPVTLGTEAQNPVVLKVRPSRVPGVRPPSHPSPAKQAARRLAQHALARVATPSTDIARPKTQPGAIGTVKGQARPRATAYALLLADPQPPARTLAAAAKPHARPVLPRLDDKTSDALFYAMASQTIEQDPLAHLLKSHGSLRPLQALAHSLSSKPAVRPTLEMALSQLASNEATAHNTLGVLLGALMPLEPSGSLASARKSGVRLSTPIAMDNALSRLSREQALQALNQLEGRLGERASRLVGFAGQQPRQASKATPQSQVSVYSRLASIGPQLEHLSKRLRTQLDIAAIRPAPTKAPIRHVLQLDGLEQRALTYLIANHHQHRTVSP